MWLGMEGTRERRVGSGVPVNYLAIVSFPGGQMIKESACSVGDLSF